MDVVGLKKPCRGLRSWIRIDASGNSEIIEVDKFTMMLQLDLPAQDLRLLDPLFVYPSTILGREKAIMVNLEQIRFIITADEVLLLNSPDSYVVQKFVVDLRGSCGVSNSESADLSRRRGSRNFHNIFGNASPHHLPFEFRALEVALETACTFLDSEAAKLEIELYPLLDELTSKISMLNLERVRRFKSRLVALTRRVQKVKDEIEQLMNDKGKSAEMYLTRKKQNVETFKGDLEQPLNDKGKLAEMYLTRKKQSMESTFYGDHSLLGNRLSVSAPVSPVASRPEVWKPEKSFSVAFRPDVWKPEKSFSIAKSQHQGMGATMNIELEMLLVATQFFGMSHL